MARKRSKKAQRRRAFKRCDYCGASVKRENWLKHLRRNHLAELTPEDKIYIYSQRNIQPLVDHTLEQLYERDESELNDFERSVVAIRSKGTEDQLALIEWYFRAKERLNKMEYNPDGLIEDNAHYKLADLLIATVESVGFEKLTGKHDTVLRSVLERFVEAQLRQGDVQTGMDTEEFYRFMEERVILTRLQQLIDASTTVELCDAVDRFLAGALVYPDGEAAEYIKTLHANPRHFAARYNLVGILIEMGRVEDAEVQLRELIKLRPAALGPSLKLAALLLDRGAADAAVTVCEEALAALEADRTEAAEEAETGPDGEGARSETVREQRAALEQQLETARAAVAENEAASREAVDTDTDTTTATATTTATTTDTDTDTATATTTDTGADEAVDIGASAGHGAGYDTSDGTGNDTGNGDDDGDGDAGEDDSGVGATVDGAADARGSADDAGQRGDTAPA